MIESSGKVKNPSSFLLQVTDICMFKCEMCRSWKSEPNLNELTIQQWKEFIVSLNGCFDSSIEIGITGGEPLLKEGVLDLVKICSENGFRTVLTTNAYLINKEMAKRIAESGLSLIFISLDSLDEQIHDSLRGVNGAYERAMKAIGYLDEFRSDLGIGIQTVITNKNLDGVIELMEWINKDKRINANYVQVINIPINSPRDSAWYRRDEFSFLWPQDQDMEKVFFVVDELIRIKKNKNKISNSISHIESFKHYFRNPQEITRIKNCPFCDKSFNISLRGDIYLCWEMEPIGNILTDNIKTLWFSEKAEQIRKIMKDCRKNCPTLINCSFEEKSTVN